MAHVVFEIVGRVVVELACVVIRESIISYSKERRANKSKSLHGQQSSITSSQNKSNHALKNFTVSKSRAVLIVSSNVTFGNDCERLVNIAFETSQIFPKIMGTYADIIQYLRTELAKQYPNIYFQIIIGPNENFGFSVDDGEYSAEISHPKYYVLIFSTKQNSQLKYDTHDANSQMLLKWT